MADALQKHAKDKLTIVHDSKRVLSRIQRLNDFFGSFPLVGGANGDRCRKFVEGREQVSARRVLEILQAAINHWLKETGQQIGRFSIWMPPNPPPREEWFTRSEAARMLWSMYKMREKQGLSETSRRTQLHVVRFVLIALYTGTRSGAIFGLRWIPSTDSGWVDLENGLIYREGQRSKQTNKRQTPVKVPPRLLAHLRRWRSIDKNPAGYVVNFNGKRIKSIKTAWNKAKGISYIPKSHTPHTLRHTRATWLMQKGVPVWEAASSLGMTVQQLERIKHKNSFKCTAIAPQYNWSSNKHPTKR